ncbi:VOC family protein [Roseovarius sp. EL26]|uniref:VOC family protein n=1 Tax=Roseovarius sp. EL26 TaxID=2126672 RepID=UPI000EA25E0B|nr:VOC family protein [Roseovarius sp. EL26]
MLELDHIAIACETLEDGRNWVETTLGVTLQLGGQHAHFGTHNMLLGLEDGLYLEVIATDPDAPPLPYPRWFDLDRFTGQARPAIWICRTGSLSEAIAQFEGAGTAVPLARGDLRWQMAVPDSGILPYDNMFPALIEWQCAPHPATRLDRSGCRLAQIIVQHPQAAELEATLHSRLTDPRVVFEQGPAKQSYVFETPMGERILS